MAKMLTNISNALICSNKRAVACLVVWHLRAEFISTKNNTLNYKFKVLFLYVIGFKFGSKTLQFYCSTLVM